MPQTAFRLVCLEPHGFRSCTAKRFGICANAARANANCPYGSHLETVHSRCPMREVVCG